MKWLDQPEETVLGNHRGKFRVTQGRQRAADSGEHERKHQSRAGIVSAEPRQHEDACADHCANSQRRQLKRPESSLQAVPAFFVGLGEQYAHRLSGEQGVAHATPPL